MGAKTSFYRTLICGLLRWPASQVRVCLCDFKVYELAPLAAVLSRTGHLDYPLVTTADGARSLLDRLHGVLESRMRARAQDPTVVFSHLITIVDEFTQVATERLTELAHMGRSLNMWLCVATQYPKAGEAISSLVRANLGARVLFRTHSGVESRCVINSPDADGSRLTGRGDCLVAVDGTVERVQAGWVSGPGDVPPAQESDISALMRHLRELDEKEHAHGPA